jgi:hypothetical protein
METIKTTGINTLDVNAREWFDKVNGNSYFAATVTINYGTPDAIEFELPFQYGYGDHYLDVTMKELVSRGYLPTNEGRLPRYCRERGIILRYSKRENCKKRDL